jgi:hypothetical protein
MIEQHTGALTGSRVHMRRRVYRSEMAGGDTLITHKRRMITILDREALEKASKGAYVKHYTE